MKFTSEDLMKAMGLQFGDRIRVNNKIYTIAKSEECQGAWIGYENETGWHNLDYLINGDDYEILPKTKRIGDLKCNEIHCINCPFKMFCRITDTSHFICNLYGALQEFKNMSDDDLDQEIYDLLKARLDKEVLENDK